MKSCVTIFLLCYFLLSALVPRMDFDWLYQIPDFAAHFFEHKEDGNDDLGFIEFINIHYGQESKEPADGHELPFQKHNCNIHSITFASFLFNSNSFVLNTQFQELNDTYSLSFTSLHLSD